MVHRGRTSAIKAARKDAIGEGLRLLAIGQEKKWVVAPDVESRAAKMCYRSIREDQKLKEKAALMAASDLAQAEFVELRLLNNKKSLFKSLFERHLSVLREEKFGTGWVSNPLFA